MSIHNAQPPGTRETQAVEDAAKFNRPKQINDADHSQPVDQINQADAPALDRVDQSPEGRTDSTTMSE